MIPLLGRFLKSNFKETACNFHKEYARYKSDIDFPQIGPKEGKDEAASQPIHTGAILTNPDFVLQTYLQPPGGGYFDPDDHLDDDLDTEEEPATSYKSKKDQQGGNSNCKSSPSFSHLHNHKSYSPSDPLQPQHQELWKNTSGHLILYPGRHQSQTK